MDTNLLDIKFARIGARLKTADRPSGRSRTSGVISLDVQADDKGEFFEIVRQPESEAEIAILDVQPADRHLLLLVREGKEKSKFLCGHDERHWFVAGIPETGLVGTVRQAKETLKPAEVLIAQANKRLRPTALNRRKKGDRTVNELASHLGVHPTLIHGWKKQLLGAIESLFATVSKKFLGYVWIASIPSCWRMLQCRPSFTQNNLI